MSLLVVTSLACAGVAPSAVQSIGQEFTIAAGKSASIQEANLVVRFDRVSNDSRCPSDAQCISAGDATVHISVAVGSGSAQAFELHTDGTRDIALGRYRLTLVELKPLPTSARPVRASEYLIVLRISQQ